MQSEDQTMTDDEVNQLISEVDQNQDGLIDYKEFLEMMMAERGASENTRAAYERDLTDFTVWLA